MSAVAGFITSDNTPVCVMLVRALHDMGFAGSCGCYLAVRHGKGLYTQGDVGWPINVFRDLDVNHCSGGVGIGFNADYISDHCPLVIHGIALSIDAGPAVIEHISSIIWQESDIVKAVRRVMLQVTEPFALLALLDNAIIAACNSGLKPLCYGRLQVNGSESGFFIASQNGIANEHARFIGSVRPGTMGVFHQKEDSVVFEQILENPDQRKCIQQALYIQGPTNNQVGNKDVGQIRRNIGMLLGGKFTESFADFVYNSSHKVVLSIPEGGNFYHRGFCDITGLTGNKAAIIRNHYPRGNVKPLPPVNRYYYLAVIPDAVVDQNVILVGDMIRSGSEIIHLAAECRNLGAKTVFAAVAAKTCRSCPNGNGAYTFPGEAKPRRAEDLGLDGFVYLEPQEIIKAIDTPNPYCFDCLQQS